MKNRLFALTAAAVLAVSLTACGSKAEEPAAADTKAEAAGRQLPQIPQERRRS